MDGNELEPLMTVDELAEYLKVAAGTIYNRVNRNEIPFVKAGRAVRFRRSEIDTWMEAHREPAEPAKEGAA